MVYWLYGTLFKIATNSSEERNITGPKLGKLETHSQKWLVFPPLNQ